ncbi:hypothetical protein DV735_g144, partial [Chaetothyriales sp. CBS 134920]
MPGGKQRVFVNLYFRDHISRTEEGIRMGHARFHWAVWVQGKNSKGLGYTNEAIQEDYYSNVPGSGGWKFRHRPANWVQSGKLMVRILAGKLPQGTTHEDVRGLLATIALPRPDVIPMENCVTWTRQAIVLCQERGWMEQFDVDTFMNNALQLGAKCLDTDKYPDEKSVANLTGRPLEEKVDIEL